MFTLGDWIFIGLATIYNTRTESGKRHLKTWESETTGGIDRFACMVGVLVSMQCDGWETESKIIALIIEVVLMIAIVGGCAIIVYDIEGEEIAKYSGRFDIEESSQEGVVKIKFDCDGKRHIIYAQTGTVLIDEN